MKNTLLILMLSTLFISCGSYEKLNKEEKFALLYEAEILQKKEARERVKEIYKKIDRDIEKKDKMAQEEKEKYEEIEKFFKSQKVNYNGWSESDNTKYPPLNEVISKGEIVSTQFRIYEDRNRYYDYLNDEFFTGIGILRNRNGEIDKVVRFQKGELVEVLQNNEINYEGVVVKEEFYKENKVVGRKIYNKKGILQEEQYILLTFPNGTIKRDYMKYRGEKFGKIREYNKYGQIISTKESRR
ncbi:hypothetical protein [Fusobacterium mortiferum]|uniref:hypothetical protein n=1 Tax=Fusobacterium mortiferum TaxID=850 RepID=UPI003F929EDE